MITEMGESPVFIRSPGTAGQEAKVCHDDSRHQEPAAGYKSSVGDREDAGGDGERIADGNRQGHELKMTEVIVVAKAPKIVNLAACETGSPIYGHT